MILYCVPGDKFSSETVWAEFLKTYGPRVWELTLTSRSPALLAMEYNSKVELNVSVVDMVTLKLFVPISCSGIVNVKGYGTHVPLLAVLFFGVSTWLLTGLMKPK
jgi:hypothetical protein